MKIRIQEKEHSNSKRGRSDYIVLSVLCLFASFVFYQVAIYTGFGLGVR